MKIKIEDYVNDDMTISSVKIVELINMLREDDAAKVRHSDFLAKVRKIMGENNSAFLSEYKDSTGRYLKCYNLPIPQALTMITSYKSTYVDFDQNTNTLNVNIVKREEYQFGSDVVYKLFDGYEVIPQHPVLNGKYKIDWYIPELKLAIEYDEEHHRAKTEKDSTRQQEIENHLGCKFLRYKK